MSESRPRLRWVEPPRLPGVAELLLRLDLATDDAVLMADAARDDAARLGDLVGQGAAGTRAALVAEADRWADLADRLGARRHVDEPVAAASNW